MSGTSPRLRRVAEVFFQVESLSASAREEVLTRLCGGDGALAAEVRTLLVHGARADGFLAEPALGAKFAVAHALGSAHAVAPASAVAPEPAGERDEIVGRTLDRYRIERRIASGGMGTVYLAVRADGQFTQRLALKLVKRGMDSEEILARFRRERQTLAALEHPNIARLIDGGVTGAGQPYLVMEFVEGETIDVYCDRRRAGLKERLELFLAVCEAVRHAHKNLVVHRDLKPANVLVTAEGTPKLLDFGIATVLDAEGARQATSPAERRLTPEYASPEQLAGEIVTTAADVYSLGVILCELLTGRVPYSLTTRTVAEIGRAMAVGPRLPSELVCHGAPRTELDERARARRSTPEQLARALRGDLDTIVLAALRREPERRYPSVERLAADVRAHLDCQPVSARRDTLAYRASRLVRRHALATTLATLSLVLLVTGTAAFAWQAQVARHERDEAVLARSRWESMTGFLEHMLESPDPASAGPTVTVRQVLDESARRLDGELGDQPIVRASLRGTIGRTYLALGLYAEAERELRECWRSTRENSGPGGLEVARSMQDLAAALHALERQAEAAEQLEGALGILRTAGASASAEAAEALSSLGVVRKAQGQDEEAERLHREALALRTRTCGPESLEAAESLNNLACLLMQDGRYAEASSMLEEALRIRNLRLGERHPLVAQSLDNLAEVIQRQGELEEAEDLRRAALELELEILGPDHPDVAVTRRNLALLLIARGEPAEAEEQLRLSLEAREKALPPAALRRVVTMLDLAEVLLAQGRGDEGEELVVAALDATEAPGADASARDLARSRAAAFFQRRGQPERAAKLGSRPHSE